MELAMTRENFWKYIAEAHKKEKDNNGIMNYLVEKLSNRSYEEIFSFGIIVDEIMLESYNQRLWCASYLLNGDTREESFDFFRLWLISQGEKVYNDVMKNPDNLIKYVEEPDEDFIADLYENEDFFFVAVDAFGIKNDMGIFDNIGEQVAQHGETIDQAIEKGAEFIDEKTGGKHSEQINQAADFVKDKVDGLANKKEGE